MQETKKTRGKTGVTSVIPRTEEKEEIGVDKEYEQFVENIRETIKEVVPTKKNLFKNGRSVSEETKQLYKDRVTEFRKDKSTSQRRKEWNRRSVRGSLERVAVAHECLFRFLCKIWRKEEVSAELAVGVFIMIFKNKGSSEDYSKYRYIGLLCHAYKIMTIILLQRLRGIFQRLTDRF